MAKAMKTIKQGLRYKAVHAHYFAATKTLFNHVCAFYFDVIQAYPGLLEHSTKEALTALEALTHMTKANPHPTVSSQRPSAPIFLPCSVVPLSM